MAGGPEGSALRQVQDSVLPAGGIHSYAKGITMAKKNAPDFEQQMQRLTAIVQELERGDLPLEENVALYKEGRMLAKSCKALLENARNEIRLCAAEGGGEFSLGDAAPVDSEGGTP